MTQSTSTVGAPITDPLPTPVKVAQPRLKANSKVQDWRRAQIVIAGFVILAVVGGVLALVTT
jgi:hypothetical protein